MGVKKNWTSGAGRGKFLTDESFWLENWTWKEEILPGPVLFQSVKVTLRTRWARIQLKKRGSRTTIFIFVGLELS